MRFEQYILCVKNPFKVVIYPGGCSGLGKVTATKSDESLEKFQTAFDLNPLIFGISYCKFFMTDMVAYMRGDMMAG